MAQSNPVQNRTASWTDTLINGLIGGIMAGVGMLVWLLLAGLLAGESPQEILQGFVIPGQQANLVTSAFLHLGVSAVYGGVYGVLLRLLPRMLRTSGGRLFSGLGYGLLLYLLASAIILPATASPLAQVGVPALTSAHLVYGVLLGALTRA